MLVQANSETVVDLVSTSEAVQPATDPQQVNTVNGKVERASVIQKERYSTTDKTKEIFVKKY